MKRLALFLLTFGLAACEAATAPDPNQELVSARARWLAQGSASYSYELTRGCFCVLAGRPIIVTVENGSVVEAEYADSKTAVDAAFLDYLETVPDLFDKIDDAIVRRVASLVARYDPTYGYPTRIEIDYSATVADDEITYSARDLMLSGALSRGSPR
jgi:hypothetical protein